MKRVVSGGFSARRVGDGQEDPRDENALAESVDAARVSEEEERASRVRLATKLLATGMLRVARQTRASGASSASCQIRDRGVTKSQNRCP